MWLVWWNFPTTKIHLQQKVSIVWWNFPKTKIYLQIIWKMWIVWWNFPNTEIHLWLWVIWKSVTSLMFHYQITQGILRVDLVVSQWEQNGMAHWSNCRPFPPYSWNFPWTCSRKHENVAIPNDSHMNWLQLRLMMKSVTSLMKFPKDQNTLTTKSVNSLIKFPKHQNILTNNLKNVTSLMFHYQITQGVLRVDS